MASSEASSNAASGSRLSSPSSSSPSSISVSSSPSSDSESSRIAEDFTRCRRALLSSRRASIISSFCASLYASPSLRKKSWRDTSIHSTSRSLRFVSLSRLIFDAVEASIESRDTNNNKQTLAFTLTAGKNRYFSKKKSPILACHDLRASVWSERRPCMAMHFRGLISRRSKRNQA